MNSSSILIVIAAAVLLLIQSPVNALRMTPVEEVAFEEMPPYEDGYDGPFYLDRRGFLASSRLGKRYQLAKKGFLSGSRLG